MPSSLQSLIKEVHYILLSIGSITRAWLTTTYSICPRITLYEWKNIDEDFISTILSNKILSNSHTFVFRAKSTTTNFTALLDSFIWPGNYKIVVENFILFFVLITHLSHCFHVMCSYVLVFWKFWCSHKYWKMISNSTAQSQEPKDLINIKSRTDRGLAWNSHHVVTIWSPYRVVKIWSSKIYKNNSQGCDFLITCVLISRIVASQRLEEGENLWPNQNYQLFSNP